MIDFQTLLLGIVFGLQPVALMVAPQVKSVDVCLDGVTVNTLSAEPWVAECDFGVSPHPHELVAIARDASGKELGRTRQWVNMPRPAAEATLLLQRGPQPNQVAAARLTWNEVKGKAPVYVRVTLDGNVLPVKNPKRFDLPACAPQQVHVLSAELVFPEGRTARADAAVGGDLADEAKSDLTGLPLIVEPGHKLPAPSEMQTWFRDGDRPLHVLGVDRSPFDVVLLLTRAACAVLAKERGAMGRRVYTREDTLVPPRLLVFAPAERDHNRLFVALAASQVFRNEDYAYHVVFSSYLPMLFYASRFRARLANIGALGAASSDEALADAVMTLGALAAASNRPRALMLVNAGPLNDVSDVPAAGARAYLRDLHVPLMVWSLLGATAPDDWGKAVDVSDEDRMDRAAKELKAQLARQQVVWFEGKHLPQRIRLVEGVVGVHLAQ